MPHFAEYFICFVQKACFRFSFRLLAKSRSLAHRLVKNLVVFMAPSLSRLAHTFLLASISSQGITNFIKGKLLMTLPRYVSMPTWEGHCKSHFVLSWVLTYPIILILTYLIILKGGVRITTTAPMKSADP